MKRLHYNKKKDGQYNPGRKGWIFLYCLLLIPSAVLVFCLASASGCQVWAALLLAGLIGAMQVACFLIIPLRIHRYTAVNERTAVQPQKDSYTQSLIAANSELSSFNFTISHEIKAPVRAIDGYARIFLEDYGERLNEEAKSMIGNIRDICTETIDLSNKLLEYTRIAQKECVYEEVDIQTVIAEIFDTLHSTRSDTESIRLVFESNLPVVLGDPTLLHLAWVNILSNAFKFTRGKENGVISVGMEKQSGEDVFYIRDNGAGFDMKFSENLFGMFQRMHSADEFEGSGIGLAIVKKIILLHNGRVWITGEVGRGATVYFVLPSERLRPVNKENKNGVFSDIH